ncbi:hypothetical protein RHIZ404_220011 [Rhizobium sp. EC-SD404]|nr:hypothetical protein RHIZ404_220011 [Rhizobium sp. EC-SD404]
MSWRRAAADNLPSAVASAPVSVYRLPSIRAFVVRIAGPGIMLQAEEERQRIATTFRCPAITRSQALNFLVQRLNYVVPSRDR